MSFHQAPSNEEVQNTHSSLHCTGQFTVQTGRFTVKTGRFTVFSTFCTDLEQPKMVKTDKNDIGGAMEAHTHSAKTTTDHRLQRTRQITSCS